ncbi:MAG: hypothetical protein KJ601_03355 [Nanoarchaeota archaeon]|nr:hypothetical protein [Nanoarchaeota archaeon]MBU1704872.1 hypothetical protein [Nanoarchaeota archaeon]
MDVQTTMRINELAKDLLTRGMAASSEEAYKMAEGIMQKQVLPNRPESVVVEKSEDKYRMLIERVSNRVDDELDKMKQQMLIMIKEIEKNTAVIAELKNRPVQTVHQAPARKPDVQTEIKAEKKEENHPRQGAFKPGDVDVNKIFYCGNK